MNGQILGRTEYAYTLFQHPKQIAWMWKDGGWTPAEVAARLRQEPRPAPAAGRHGHAEVDAEVDAVHVRWPLGVVDIVYARARRRRRTRARRGAADGFAHIDPLLGTDPATLALPIGCPTAFPKPATGGARRPRRRDGDGMWDRAVRWWRAAPRRAARAVGGRGRELARDGATRSAPRCRACGCSSTPGTSPTGAAIRASCSSSPTTCSSARASPGHTQVHVDDPTRRRRLRRRARAASTQLDYRGKLSVEYFDLPENGWPLDDPEQWARDLAAHVRALA